MSAALSTEYSVSNVTRVPFGGLPPVIQAFLVTSNAKIWLSGTKTGYRNILQRDEILQSIETNSYRVQKGSTFSSAAAAAKDSVYRFPFLSNLEDTNIGPELPSNGLEVSDTLVDEHDRITFDVGAIKIGTIGVYTISYTLQTLLAMLLSSGEGGSSGAAATYLSPALCDIMFGREARFLKGFHLVTEKTQCLALTKLTGYQKNLEAFIVGIEEKEDRPSGRLEVHFAAETDGSYIAIVTGINKPTKSSFVISIYTALETDSSKVIRISSGQTTAAKRFTKLHIHPLSTPKILGLPPSLHNSIKN